LQTTEQNTYETIKNSIFE